MSKKCSKTESTNHVKKATETIDLRSKSKNPNKELSKVRIESKSKVDCSPKIYTDPWKVQQQLINEENNKLPKYLREMFEKPNENQHYKTVLEVEEINSGKKKKKRS